MQEYLRLIFRSSHGDRFLEARKSESIIDVCRKYGIPSTQISTYLQTEDGKITLFVRPNQPFGDYVNGHEVIIFPNRNIDYHALLGGEDRINERIGASTWIKVREHNSVGEHRFITEYLNPEEAQEIVAMEVKEALLHAKVADEPIVIGTSGGGDSNALLGAIVKSGLISSKNIIPVMMLGIPDWDKGVERAEAICKENGLKLKTVSDKETAEILGFSDPDRDWVTAFEREFPGDDLEVLGVYAVRRVLESVAKDEGARTIVIGSNLEDCLSDVLYYISSGKVPFPKPIGTMGHVDILYPLWLTPKSIIDGCYPKYSLENYEARYPSKMYGRAYFYYLAQMLVEAYPGAGQDILRGSSKLSDAFFKELPYDEEFDTPIVSPIPLDIRMKLRKLFGGK